LDAIKPGPATPPVGLMASWREVLFLKLLQEIPLGEAEQAAIEEGVSAYGVSRLK
jgi:hypothetical protein